MFHVPSFRIVVLGMLLTLIPPLSAMTTEDLLKQLKAELSQQPESLALRESRFATDVATQKQQLTDIQQQLATEKERGALLAKQFDQNETELAGLEQTLTNKVGSLGEMFGVVRQVAGDIQAPLAASLTVTEHPQRDAFLNKLAESKALPSIRQLEQFWLLFMEEMTASGQVVTSTQSVTLNTGINQPQPVTRIGLFNLVSNGQYLHLNTETSIIEQQSRQPAWPVPEQLATYQASNDTYAEVYLDPTGGSLLSLLVQSPSLEERVRQGGVIGYVIIGLAAIGLLLAVIRYLQLTLIGVKMRRQMRSGKIQGNNPMALLLQAWKSHPNLSLEELEAKLDDVIIKQVFRLERGVGLIKLLASVAPLLGLLGTVVGMIATFQSITLFGTSDPKLMAGGISEALVTTMLGLIAAVPLVFLHSLVAAKSKSLIQILEEQGSGFIARRIAEESPQPSLSTTSHVKEGTDSVAEPA